MANCNQLKLITKARLKSASILMDAGDWDGSIYMMGHVLECALKAAVCKSLRLNEYPEGSKDKHFMTHNFDQLLVLSGLSDIFNLNTIPDTIFRNWSEFTQEFTGNWPEMRYDYTRLQLFDEVKAKKLYDTLTNKPHGIIETIKIKKRW